MMYFDDDDDELEQRTVQAVVNNTDDENVIRLSQCVDLIAEYCTTCKTTRAIRCAITSGVVHSGKTRRIYKKRSGICPVCGEPIGRVRFEKL